MSQSWTDDDAALLVLTPPGRRTVLGCGDPAAARRLLAAHADGIGRVDLATLPRLGAGPEGVRGAPDHEGPLLAPDDDVPPGVRDVLGLQAATAWDRLVTHVPPAPGAGAELLDLRRDEPAVRACLAAANPGSQADPSHPDEAAWFGVRDGGVVVGVIGASRRRGDPGGHDVSWHLHGLGVLPSHRRQGLGAALTATAGAAAFESGVDWVSLGMYADNSPARRVYERLGFQVEGRFTTYRAPRA